MAFERLRWRVGGRAWTPACRCGASGLFSGGEPVVGPARPPSGRARCARPGSGACLARACSGRARCRCVPACCSAWVWRGVPSAASAARCSGLVWPGALRRSGSGAVLATGSGAAVRRLLLWERLSSRVPVHDARARSRHGRAEASPCGRRFGARSLAAGGSRTHARPRAVRLGRSLCGVGAPRVRVARGGRGARAAPGGSSVRRATPPARDRRRRRARSRRTAAEAEPAAAPAAAEHGAEHRALEPEARRDREQQPERAALRAQRLAELAAARAVVEVPPQRRAPQLRAAQLRQLLADVGARRVARRAVGGQRRARLVDVGLHLLAPAVEDPRDLVVGDVAELGQHERRALVVRQPGEAGEHGAELLARGDLGREVVGGRTRAGPRPAARAARAAPRCSGCGRSRTARGGRRPAGRSASGRGRRP